MSTKDEIEKIYDEIVDIRRCLHSHPELSEMEYKTSDTICKVLDRFGIEYKRGFADTGVVAIIRGSRPGKTVAIRADMDALPIAEKVDVTYKSQNEGIMHACGHDIHMAIALGAGKLLYDIRDNLEGNIKLFFQPAEETIGGAFRMIEDGCMEDPYVDFSLGLHVEPDVSSGMIELAQGKMNAAATEIDMTVRGVASHGAHPSYGVDAVVSMSLIITALQSFVSRNIAPENQAVVSLGTISGGVKRNIIADQVTVSGILRTLDQETCAHSKKRIREIVEHTAAAMGAKVELKLTDVFPALINSKEIFDIIDPLAVELLGQENVLYKKNPSMGADDFACFINHNKGLYFNLGTRGLHQKGLQTLHSETFNPDEGCIKVGILVMVEGAKALLSREG
ncbi:MAG: amidohydrolase [Clostridia bacterium]|nr:amidohydrolase [Clostridia bacterium]